MSAAFDASVVGKAILDELGIDSEDVTSVVLECDAARGVTLRVERQLQARHSRALRSVLQTYDVTPREGPYLSGLAVVRRCENATEHQEHHWQGENNRALRCPGVAQ